MPAIFDYLQPDGYFKQHEAEIVGVSKEIALLENSEEYSRVRQALSDVKQQAEREIADYKALMQRSKMERNERRQVLHEV